MSDDIEKTVNVLERAGHRIDTLEAQLRDLRKALRRIRLRVEPGRSGSYTLQDSGEAISWIDDECRRALVQGGRDE